MSSYIRLAEGLNKYKLIPTTENVWDHISSNDKDYYTSIFQYNDAHYKQWKEKRTVSGIKDVTTNKLVFDFDDAANPETARGDALTLVTRLLSHGLTQENIQVSFSGSKGYCVEVETTESFTPEQFKNVTFALASDLPSFDSVVNDPNRIVRVVGTRHPKSGLYKFPLSTSQLSELNTDTIKSLATSVDNINEDVINAWTQAQLPTSITSMQVSTKKETATLEPIDNDLDLSKKPKWLSDAKYALQEGYFGSGERNTAFMVLASTYKNQGFSKEIVYRMLKGVAEIQARRNNVERYADEELYNNIVEVVCSPNWKGGSYSFDNTPLLQEVTKRMGLKVPSADSEDKPRFITDVTSKFKIYVKNIEKNTIKTGIKSLDDNLFISTGTNLGILGAPGSGKSSLALEILRNTSRNGVKSVFASLDMASTRIYEKILYKLTGKKREEIYNAFKADDEEKLVKELEENFGNVYFFDKSSPTVADIREYILKCQEHSGEKIKLVMIDYFERVSTDVGDDTAASKKIAGQLQDLVNDLDICLITLVQPNKMSGDMSEPIYSYTNIKGSSFLAQSFRMILSIYREGFNPRNPDEDRYLTVNVLKNDLGETASFDFSWNGKRGEISEIDEMERLDLEDIRKRKAMENDGEL